MHHASALILSSTALIFLILRFFCFRVTRVTQCRCTKGVHPVLEGDTGDTRVTQYWQVCTDTSRKTGKSSSLYPGQSQMAGRGCGERVHDLQSNSRENSAQSAGYSRSLPRVNFQILERIQKRGETHRPPGGRQEVSEPGLNGINIAEVRKVLLSMLTSLLHSLNPKKRSGCITQPLLTLLDISI